MANPAVVNKNSILEACGAQMLSFYAHANHIMAEGKSLSKLEAIYRIRVASTVRALVHLPKVSEHLYSVHF